MSEHQSNTQTENTASVTVTVSSSESDTVTQDLRTVRLKLIKPKSRKKVNWTEETVDNENMDKKKSKCCCIYQKPKTHHENSSDDESDDNNECENCFGHVEKKKAILQKHNKASSSDATIQSMITA